MNQTQKNYIKNRVVAIKRAKEMEIRKKYTTEGKSLTGVEMISLIRNGKVKMLPESEVKVHYNGGYINSIFDFSKYVTKQKFAKANYDAEMKKLNKLANRLLDEVMLGDCEAALDMIAELEAF
jgi:hypothetical protein